MFSEAPQSCSGSAGVINSLKMKLISGVDPPNMSRFPAERSMKIGAQAQVLLIHTYRFPLMTKYIGSFQHIFTMLTK